MFKARHFVALVGLICLATLALACQTGRASFNQNSTTNANRSEKTASGSMQVAELDRTFAAKATAGGKQEVELGKLAAQQASNSDVKAFANRMVQDHSKAGDELMQITNKLGLSLPAEDDRMFIQVRDNLSKLKGADFDRMYMNEMVDGHTKVANEFESYVNTGTNPDLKAWASKTLPTVREHLQQAKDIAAKVGGKTK
jgi:putative membrane protein